MDQTLKSNGENPETTVSQDPEKRSPSPSAFRKQCNLCHEPNDVIIRCKIDDTSTWHFICPKACWTKVSGGVVDGDENHPYYKYGGMWKNQHAYVAAKKPKRKNETAIVDWQPDARQYVASDRVRFDKRVWLCRRSHESNETNAPRKSSKFWMGVG